MNFRSCEYFLTVCQLGTISAAARRLYISQQSLSHHILAMEKELGVQLFHRENPIVLTEAGECVRRASQTILDAREQMEREIAACAGRAPEELALGMADYGVPDFLPPIIEEYLREHPRTLLSTRIIAPGESMPEDVQLVFSARELGGGFRSELLFTDRPVVCVADSLLQKQYGAQWRERKERLERGDLSALAGCPFVRHRNTPLEDLSNMIFAANGFEPEYLPVMGGTEALVRLAISGQAATITFLDFTERAGGILPCYPIRKGPEEIPAGFVCYRTDRTLSEAARRFLDITRRYMAAGRERAGYGP